MIAEVKAIWADDLAKTASRPFRGLSDDEGDSYIVFLYTQCVKKLSLREHKTHRPSKYSYIVERHREALLWTWLVAKIATDGDKPSSTTWGADQARAAWLDIGGVEGEDKLRPLRRQDRTTRSSAQDVIADEEGKTRDGHRLRTNYVWGASSPPHFS